MNILSYLPFLNPAREQAEQEGPKGVPSKGPQRVRHITNGQIRRAQDRARARRIQRTRKAQVRQHFAMQRELAVVGAWLREAGIDARTGTSVEIVSPTRARAGVIRLVQRFADSNPGEQVIVTESLVWDSLDSALSFWQRNSGVPATGISMGYALPVTVQV